MRGVWVQALFLPRLPVLRAGCRGQLVTCCGRGCAGVGAQQCLFGFHALREAACRGGGRGRPRGADLPPLWRVSGVRRCPSPGRPSFGADSRGSATRVSRPRLVWTAWGPSTGPTACALASRRCALWQWREGVPGGGALRPCEGHLSSGALPPPAARPQGGLSGSATHMLWARVCGRGCPALSLWLACPAGGCVPRKWWEAIPGGWPSTIVRCVWCQALSLPRLPVPWGGQPGFHNPWFPGVVGVAVETQHRPHNMRSCKPSLRAVGVAGGRPRGGCLAPL